MSGKHYHSLWRHVIFFILVVVLINVLFRNVFFHKCSGSRVVTTQMRLKELHQAVNMFRVDTGRYPSQEKGLLELIEKPDDVQDWSDGGYLVTNHLPKDAWGVEFFYKLTPDGERPFVIISYGKDKTPGGEDDNTDLSSICLPISCDCIH